VWFLLKYLIFLLIAFEIETSASYLVTYFDVNKYDYKSSEDYFYQILKVILPFYDDLFFYIGDFIPGTNSYTAVIVMLIILALFKRIRTKKVNILIWGALFCKALAITRLIRVLAFSSTLMPNPRQNCYNEHFRVPESTIMMIGDMMSFRTAGCNDLVASGHTLFIWMSVKYICIVMNGWSAKLAKYLVTPIVLINIVMKRNHYSLDIILGLAIGELVWRLVKTKEKKYFPMHNRDDSHNELVTNVNLLVIEAANTSSNNSNNSNNQNNSNIIV